MRLLFIIVIGLSTYTLSAQKPPKLKPFGYIHIDVPEPSDIIANPFKPNHFFVVSDDGFLFEMNRDGKITRKADFTGIDCEGVYANDTAIFVVEEYTRKIRVFDYASLSLQQTAIFPYSGGRNKGYESITYNEVRQRFLMITEKDPIYLVELDKDLNRVNEVYLEGIARDISAATWYDNHVWLLSDEDMEVIKLNPNNYQEIMRWRIPIINPEGICFYDNRMFILSDDMERLYEFPIPQ